MNGRAAKRARQISKEYDAYPDGVRGLWRRVLRFVSFLTGANKVKAAFRKRQSRRFYQDLKKAYYEKRG